MFRQAQHERLENIDHKYLSSYDLYLETETIPIPLRLRERASLRSWARARLLFPIVLLLVRVTVLVIEFAVCLWTLQRSRGLKRVYWRYLFDNKIHCFQYLVVGHIYYIHVPFALQTVRNCSETVTTEIIGFNLNRHKADNTIMPVPVVSDLHSVGSAREMGETVYLGWWSKHFGRFFRFSIDYICCYARSDKR